jgi:hypothetical protein
MTIFWKPVLVKGKYRSLIRYVSNFICKSKVTGISIAVSKHLKCYFNAL